MNAKPLRASASAAALLLTAALGAAPAAAQTAAPAAAIEEVVVTGSRLRRAALNAEDLVLGFDVGREAHGRMALGDMLARMPMAGAAISPRFNSSGNFGFPADGGGVGAGAARVDLRHLGSKRVLVLVDGLRWVAGASASGVSGATDLNTLPASAVERIEVSLDGASAVYGSDAIAGVVNLITRAADGVSASLYGGAFAHGGETRAAEFEAGRRWGETSAALHVSHTDAGGVGSHTHPQSRWPFPGVDNRHGSTFTPQGRVIFTDPNTGRFVNCALNDGVVGAPRYDPAAPCGAGDDYHPWSNADRFNYAPFNLLLTPSRRSAVFARVERRLGAGVTAWARLLANHRRSVNRAAPEPLWAGSLAASGSVLDEIAIDAAHPRNPFGFDIGDGAWATRRPLESGPRIFTQNVYTRYIAAGLRGTATVWRRAMHWDANWVWSRNVARQTKLGAHNARRLLVALGPPEACAATPGCVPLNLLGGQGDGAGTLTAPMLRWIRFVQRDYSDQGLRDLTVNVSGDVAQLPAGGLALAAGFERREQRGKFVPDPVVAAGDTAGLAASPTAGEQTVNEWYAELEAPLLAGPQGGERVAVAAAARWFRYGALGGDQSRKVDLRWRPRPNLLVRAHWGEGFRAPNIGELHGGETRLDAVIADPCSAIARSGLPAAAVARCVAAGVPADGGYAQLGSQTSIRTGGNPRLVPETSTSRTLAVSWRGDRGRVALGHYRHRVDGAIAALDAQAVLDNCYQAGLTAFCRFVKRGPGGHISDFANTLLNVGVIDTSGYDLEAEAHWGGARLRWRATYLDKYDEMADAAGGRGATRRLAGKTAGDRGKPRWKASLGVEWNPGRWRLAWTARYIHAMTERCSNFLDGTPDSFTNLGLCSLPDHANHAASRNRLASVVYHDVEASVAPTWADGRWDVALGVTNALDQDPPASLSATLNGYDASTYDIPGGRFAYARLRYRGVPRP